MKAAEDGGVEYIFGVPGEEKMDLLDTMLGPPIRFVMTRHEQGAVFMLNEQSKDAWGNGPPPSICIPCRRQ